MTSQGSGYIRFVDLRENQAVLALLTAIPAPFFALLPRAEHADGAAQVFVGWL